MNVLITGASGFVGRALVERLLSRGHTLVGLSRTAQPATTGVTWVQHDLFNDPPDHLSLPPVEVVYHLAGQTSTYQAQKDPIGDLSVNVVGSLRLLEYFRKQQLSPFVVITGTATEVGLSDRLPINEDLSDHPVTFYDLSKLTAERYLQQYVREGWIRGCCLRLANVFGRPDRSREIDRGIIDKVFNRALAGQRITIYGSGAYVRDYIFIDDVVAALEVAPQYPDSTNGRVFYIGSGTGIALKDAFLQVGALAATITGVPVEHEHVAPPPGLSPIEFRNAIIDTSAFRTATGWRAEFDFAAGLDAAYGSISRDPHRAT
jgi:nucleoside-diphosphate-sugar epimerase